MIKSVGALLVIGEIYGCLPALTRVDDASRGPNGQHLSAVRLCGLGA